MVANANARVIGHCDFGVILSILHGAETPGEGVYATVSLAGDYRRRGVLFQHDRNKKARRRGGRFRFQPMVGVARIELATPTMST